VAEFIYQMIKARKAIGDKVILDDVTMSFFPGAKIGMVGPNGAGKSSILKIMAGLDEPSNGEARLTPGYTVGILMQEPVLDETKTVTADASATTGFDNANTHRTPRCTSSTRRTGSFAICSDSTSAQSNPLLYKPCVLLSDS